MYYLRYWARYMRKGEVKSGGIKIGYVTPVHTKKKIERFLAREGVLSGGVLGLNTLCRGCSSQRRSAPVTKFSQPRA